MTLLLGAIADDFTGATDLANTLVKNGMNTVLQIGVPDPTAPVPEAEAIVIALKSRTAPTDQAVGESLLALQWLQASGAKQYFFKYCSTFDSTDQGNIGPVADALLEKLEADLAIICPAFPTTGRSIYQGYLFVGDQLLSESPMKDHPLTPMTDSSLVRLMSAQTLHKVASINYAAVAQGAAAIEAEVESLKSQGYRYAVVDALTDKDLGSIGKAVAGHKLITGGSGVALGLPENFRDAGDLKASSAISKPQAMGRQIILAGSCSQMTRKQIAYFEKSLPSMRLDIEGILNSRFDIQSVLDWVHSQPANVPALVYSSSGPETISAIQAAHGQSHAGEAVEKVFGELAVELIENGVGQMIVAGGETSGAVVSALAINALKIGPEIDPGVPWTEVVGDLNLSLALKSGNFGAEDFFTKAFAQLS